VNRSFRSQRLDRLVAPVLTAVAVLVHSNVFISLSATGVALATILLVDLPPEPLPLGIVFVATLFVYSLNRLTDAAEDATNVPERAAFTERHGRKVLAVGATLYLGAVALAFVRGLPMAEFLLLPVAVAVLYSVGRLKRVLLVKNLLVGAAWGVIPLGVGVYYGVLRSVEILFLSGFFAAMLTVAAAVFDIKDIEGDRSEGIRTVPIVFGPQATRVGAGLATAAVAVAVVAAVLADALPPAYLVLLGFLGYVAAYVPFATRKRGSLFYGFVVDGEHTFLAVLVVALELL
jgi:4-hydroxybenzoate polyprenyltransferase